MQDVRGPKGRENAQWTILRHSLVLPQYRAFDPLVYAFERAALRFRGLKLERHVDCRGVF